MLSTVTIFMDFTCAIKQLPDWLTLAQGIGFVQIDYRGFSRLIASLVYPVRQQKC